MVEEAREGLIYYYAVYDRSSWRVETTSEATGKLSFRQAYEEMVLTDQTRSDETRWAMD